ncbi:ribosomal protein S18-alanine N-acetyltransferase [Microbacterium sp. ARD32]|uniref:ribosomal protein S18-alanine N-acetyltransferase n=1 Tax=Microbacterium sp. ARD32 TaxID=2962577 RepID=UPI002880C131|nr:ribosomal protein S18-alanine N-acetyltransferase [Microbacterium sp. ARD32]MDT0156422.1 ribosomal protein S18-alanine N-acetyltransferase [Microbacterium sp. ARD32]
MTLRTATIDDLDAIMSLERRSFPTDAWSEATMRAEIASDHNHYLVDEQDGSVVGYGGLRALHGGADADIQTIALSAEVRGRGRGRALLRALIAEAVARGARELFLEVRADNPVAEGLYRSEGFTELGRRPRYYQPDDVDAVVMRLDLRSWAAREAQEISRNAGADADMRPADHAKSCDSHVEQEASA